MENRVVLHEKSDEEIIDAVLTFIIRGKREWTLRNLVMIPNKRRTSIIDKLFGLDLMQKCSRQFTSYGDNIEITKKGLSILAEYGSYMNYKKQRDLEIERENAKSELEKVRLMKELEALKIKPSEKNTEIEGNINNFVKAFCSKCRQKTNHKVLLEKSQIFDQIDFIEKRKWQIIECGCDTISFRETYDNNEDWGDGIDQAKELVYQYPQAQKHIPKSFTSAPLKIQNIYRETVDAFNNRLLILCSAGCRSVVEGICDQQNASGSNLKTKIVSLFDQGIITNINSEALQNHRFIGNNAVHSLIHLSDEDLKTAIEIIEHTIENIYELNVMGTSLRNKLSGK